MKHSLMRTFPKECLHMILLPFAFLNETLPLELPWQVWCSFSLSSLPFYASYPNVEDARICLRLDPPFIVVPIPILLIHIAAKPINGDDYLRAERPRMCACAQLLETFFLCSKKCECFVTYIF